MRRTALLTLVLTCAAFGQERGVFLEDIDRNVDACTNFFDYANGAWRAKNPIPPSMTRWSRRWAAGELSKEQLRAILDETSARRDWRKDRSISSSATSTAPAWTSSASMPSASSLCSRCWPTSTACARAPPCRTPSPACTT